MTKNKATVLSIFVFLVIAFPATAFAQNATPTLFGEKAEERQGMMEEKQEERDARVEERQEALEERQNEREQNIEEKKDQIMQRSNQRFANRVMFRQEYALKHVERVRGLVNKFMERVAIMEENGAVVPVSVETDFESVLNTLVNIETVANNLSADTNATTAEELKVDYDNTKQVLADIRTDFQGIKTVLVGTLQTIKDANVQNDVMEQ